MRGNAIRIEDHDDAAVTQDGIAGEHLDVAQDWRHRLYDNFLGIEHAVDHDAEAVGTHLGHNDECIVANFGLFGFQAQQFTQGDEWQQPVAQAQNRRVFDLLDLELSRAGGAYQFDDADLRDRKAFATTFNDQCRHDRQRQRDFDDEGRALAFRRPHFDGAANLFNIRLDDIHADATAGHARYFCRRGETRLENELLDLLFAHCLHFGLRGETVLNGFGFDLGKCEATAIIADFDDDMPALVIGVEGNLADFSLTGLAPLFRNFQAMISGITHHVGERILDHFENLAIQFGLLTDHDQIDLLLQFVTEIPNEARQFGPGVANRLHAGLHDPFLQLRGDMVQALQGCCKLAVFVFAQDLQHLVAGQHQFTDHRHQVFQQIHVYADRLIGDGRILIFRILTGCFGRRLFNLHFRLMQFGDGCLWQDRLLLGLRNGLP